MDYQIFENKNILIFLPHQDDEINLVYGILDGIKDKKCNVKIIYSTNGDYVVPAKYRIKEAIDSLKLVGIKKENIIFMGYSDQAYENDDHLYHTKDKWISKNNITETYTPDNRDYHYLKYNEHASFNHTNFVNDIYDIINDEKADFLICVDFDSHPDHRALSLSFEKALGKILNESNYRPIVYKAFAYPTSYKGIKDFNYNNPSTKNNGEEFGYRPVENPYYNWQDRIRFRQTSRANRNLLINNIYYRGLLKHKSQYILNVYSKIINSDIVFFERKTDNLLYGAEVKTSSGDKQFLNDFMLFDCSNIMHGDESFPNFDQGYTTFDEQDQKKTINIKFKEEQTFNYIKIYTGITSGNIDSILISYNKTVKEFKVKKKNNAYLIENDFSNVKNLEIKIISNDKQIMIGEIEIVKKENSKNTYAKLMINDDFIYNYYSDSDFKFEYYTDYNSNDLKIEKNKNKYILKDKNNKILDTIIIKNSKLFKIKIAILKIINNLTFFIGRIYQKMIKELRRFFK